MLHCRTHSAYSASEEKLFLETNYIALGKIRTRNKLAHLEQTRTHRLGEQKRSEREKMSKQNSSLGVDRNYLLLLLRVDFSISILLFLFVARVSYF